MADQRKPGPTGDFPQGKLNADDEGGLRISISPTEDGANILLYFGKPVAWVAFPPQQAVEFAELLIKNARRVARETGEVLTIEIGG